MIGDPKTKQPRRKSQFAVSRPSARSQVAGLGTMIDTPRPDIQGAFDAAFISGQKKKIRSYLRIWISTSTPL